MMVWNVFWKAAEAVHASSKERKASDWAVIVVGNEVPANLVWIDLECRRQDCGSVVGHMRLEMGDTQLLTGEAWPGLPGLALSWKRQAPCC